MHEFTHTRSRFHYSMHKFAHLFTHVFKLVRYSMHKFIHIFTCMYHNMHKYPHPFTHVFNRMHYSIDSHTYSHVCMIPWISSHKHLHVCITTCIHSYKKSNACVAACIISYAFACLHYSMREFAHMSTHALQYSAYQKRPAQSICLKIDLVHGFVQQNTFRSWFGNALLAHVSGNLLIINKLSKHTKTQSKRIYKNREHFSSTPIEGTFFTLCPAAAWRRFHFHGVSCGIPACRKTKVWRPAKAEPWQQLYDFGCFLNDFFKLLK